jgi:hypothetical protein
MGVTRFALLVVIGSMALSGCTGEAGTPGTPAPSRSSTLAGSHPGETTWADLPVGRPPQIPYVRGRRYITPQGPDAALPADERGVSGVIPFSGGILVSDATYFEGTNGLAIVKDGSRVESWPSGRHCSSGTPVATTDGRYAAWVTVRCPETTDRSIGAVHRARTDGSVELAQPIGPGLANVVGFLGRRVVYNRGFQDGAWVTDLQGRPRRIPGVDRVWAVNQATGSFIGGLGDRMRVVVDADGAVRWRVRAGSLVAFSPDGTQVLAVQTRRKISVLNARDGSKVEQVDLPVGVGVFDTVWETNGTLLMLMQHKGSVAVVRVRLNGRIERTTPAVRLDGGLSPYVTISRW